MTNLKIIKEEQNPLFGRKEVSVSLESEVTPRREEVLEDLSKQFKTPKENIKIKKINQAFGSKTIVIDANIYNSKEEKDKLEIKKKKEAEAEKKAEEALKATEAPKVEEKPVEETPVEKTEENKS